MIRLKNNYQIQSDGNSYQLIYETDKTDKDGNLIYSIEGYYSSLEQCLQGYSRKVVMNKVAEQDLCLYDVLNELKELKKEIKQYD